MLFHQNCKPVSEINTSTGLSYSFGVICSTATGILTFCQYLKSLFTREITAFSKDSRIYYAFGHCWAHIMWNLCFFHLDTVNAFFKSSTIHSHWNSHFTDFSVKKKKECPTSFWGYRTESGVHPSDPSPHLRLFPCRSWVSSLVW